jgi:hypothetical protein
VLGLAVSTLAGNTVSEVSDIIPVSVLSGLSSDTSCVHLAKPELLVYGVPETE